MAALSTQTYLNEESPKPIPTVEDFNAIHRKIHYRLKQAGNNDRDKVRIQGSKRTYSFNFYYENLILEFNFRPCKKTMRNFILYLEGKKYDVFRTKWWFGKERKNIRAFCKSRFRIKYY